MAELGIGDVAQLTNTNPSTLRLWERHGLVQPQRSESGQRVYTAEDVQTIRTIHRLRKADGLNMSAIKRALKSARGAGSGEPARQTGNDDVTLRLGERFRLARRRKSMSMREAAAATGLSASFISTFERTGQGGTVTSLQKLALAYGVTVTELSEDAAQLGGSRSSVVRSGAARQAPQFGPGINIFELAEGLHSLDCQRWLIEPGASSDGAYAHEGEEFIHVVDGLFSISLDGGEPHELKAGDSISFNSQTPHSWRAIGDRPTVLLWINTPKSF